MEEGCLSHVESQPCPNPNNYFSKNFQISINVRLIKHRNNMPAMYQNFENFNKKNMEKHG